MNAFAIPVLPHEPSHRYMGLSVAQWVPLLFCSAGAALIPALWYGEYALWAWLGLFLTLVIFAHLCMVADRYVAFPGLVAVVGSLQWLLAPLFEKFFPPTFSQYDFAIPLSTYFQYAIPATGAFWLGIHWPVNKAIARGSGWAPVGTLPSAIRKRLDQTIFLTILLAMVYARLPAWLGFIVYIVASLRFFAVLAWMLSRTPGWRIRALIVGLHLLTQATADGIFYQLIHWGGYFVLLYGFRQHWRRKLAFVLLTGIVGAGLLQYVKSDYRDYISYQDLGVVERISKLGELAWSTVAGSRNEISHITFADVLVRFNEGWIVSRIMYRVPHEVPYANGETVEEAILYTVIPRALSPQKPLGASKILFERFTGIRLGESTSMSLSVIGELYANFGPWGGVATTFLFALLIGFCYRLFATLAQRSPFWWAMVPVALLAAVEPAWNLEDISNHIFKAGVMVFLLVCFVPWIRGLLGVKLHWWRGSLATRPGLHSSAAN